MKSAKPVIFLVCALAHLILPYSSRAQAPEDSELYRTVKALDATYFDAYNTCNLEVQAQLMDDELEFYHDQGGLSTSKSELITSIRENICGKVTRELIPESLEVYEINGFGAVSIGYHRFFNKLELDAPSKPSRFVTVWKKYTDRWTMYRVISLH